MTRARSQGDWTRRSRIISTAATAGTAGSTSPCLSYAEPLIHSQWSVLINFSLSLSLSLSLSPALVWQIITKNGRAGVNGEHSPQDAPAPTRLLDMAFHMESVEQYNDLAHHRFLTATATKVHAVQRLLFDVSPLHEMIFELAALHVRQLIERVRICVLDFRSYGGYVAGQSR